MTRSSLHTFKLATLAAAIAMTALPAAAQQYTLILPSPGVASDPLRNLGVNLADVSLPSGLPGQPYSADLRGALQITDDLPGEPEVAQWNIVSGALPEGLTFIDGVITGTPTRVEDAHFMVQVTYRGKGAERTYNIPIDLRIGLAAATLPKGQAGAAYPSFDLKPLLSATGLTDFDPLGTTWSLGVGSSLPEGLTLDPNTGLISGTPTNEGDSQFEIVAAYQGASVAQTYEVSIGELIGWMHPNGVTVMCPDAKPGATFILAETGKTYEVLASWDKSGAKSRADKACTSNITDMSYMGFSTTYNREIGHWDTSSVTNMHEMFSGAESFNQDIGRWDTSSVTNMMTMFQGASKFNADISGWDIRNVTTMNRMFRNASAFNADIGVWDTSNVTDMTQALQGTTAFNQDLSGWCVSKIATKPSSFDSSTNAWVKEGRQPIWGTCPSQ